MKISELYRSLTPLEGVTGSFRPERPEGSSSPSEFKRVLENSLTLSEHAQTRIQSREIPWSADMERRISAGIEAAHQKGSREALILADDIAVIANVRSRTVVTAMDRAQMKEKIFTNIDSAVLV